MNEKMTKAIMDSKFELVIDTYGQKAYVSYPDETEIGEKNETFIEEKYDVIIPDIETVKSAIKYAVDCCVIDGKYNSYMKDIGIVKGILKFYTNIPDDYFTDSDIDTIINKDMLYYDHSIDINDSRGNIMLRRYYEAVCDELDYVKNKYCHTTDFQRFLDSIVGGFTVENKETNELFSGLIGTIVDRYGDLIEDNLK